MEDEQTEAQSRMDPGAKGCFVCGKDHRDNTCHSREEVTAAVKKLMEKHPKAFLTVEDLSAVVNMPLEDSPSEEQDADDFAEWANDEDDDENPEIDFLTMNEAAEVYKALENRVFVHGRSSAATTASALDVMYTRRQMKRGAPFDGVKLETAANWRYVMERSQLEELQRGFYLKTALRPSPKKG